MGFQGCNLGGCDFKACRVLDEQLQDAVNWRTGRITLRISDPHYCGHCGKQREVWGTKELAEKHHMATHKSLPKHLVSISMEEGCRHMAAAAEVGQAAWALAWSRECNAVLCAFLVSKIFPDIGSGD